MSKLKPELISPWVPIHSPHAEGVLSETIAGQMTWYPADRSDRAAGSAERLLVELVQTSSNMPERAVGSKRAHCT